MNLKNRIERLEIADSSQNLFPAWYRFRETGELPTDPDEFQKVEELMAFFMVSDATSGQALTLELLDFTPTERAVREVKHWLIHEADGSCVPMSAEEYAEHAFSTLEQELGMG